MELLWVPWLFMILVEPNFTFAAETSPACEDNLGCIGLAGDCCPASDGLMLACCEQPEPDTTEAPTTVTSTPSSAACAANSGCSNLAGDCCPAPNGMMLACCSVTTSPEPPVTTSPEPPVTTSLEPPDEGYDIIVVGGGLVGSALTARMIEKLSADQRVLLLEGGRASHHDVGGSDLPASCTSQGCTLWPSTPWQSWPTSRRTRFDVPGNYMELPCWDRSCQHSWSRIPAFQCKILGVV